ncbi:gluconate:H+ symporter, GntP family protein [Actinomadura sp. NBRC 104425]|uniref:GntP family permease n=1 Tax=Actinomadura sp. NBRC 104425 TaxID=3032204 RepID=UPI0024A0AB70|nr:gluconate:H+ symporter [Actinomadura sp. NBRC 104425]GLZ13951.1 gluconate:H+ symporter, GntP family protein [Actinomadura sp. NBRC 104425]
MTGFALTALALAPPEEPIAGGGRLVLAALAGIALIVALITWLKVHPFLGLTLGSLLVGGIAGLPMADTISGFGDGFGSTAAGVGALIALGAMFGRLLADSGGADQIVDTIVGRAGPRALPWAMALVGALIGLPMFFEIGLVLLMPVIFLVARRSGLSLVRVGIPALAGLSAMHGLVPPHPGPLVAIDALKADLGVTLALGVLVALPTIAVSGPLFARYAARWVDVPAPALYETGPESDAAGAARRRPSFGATLATVLLPVVLMMGKALADIFLDEGDHLRTVLDNLGTPLVALLIAVVVAMFTFGRGAGMSLREVSGVLEKSLPPIAGILLIVAAGGGFKQTLIDTGIGKLVADWVADSGLSVLLLAWVVAVLIRLATGSATVATVTAAGIMAPLVTTLSSGETSLLVLAIGTGSVFFSHVNDAGFWLVKEYFGLSVGQNVKSWSLMETVLSVTGLVFVLLLDLVV